MKWAQLRPEGSSLPGAAWRRNDLEWDEVTMEMSALEHGIGDGGARRGDGVRRFIEWFGEYCRP